MGLLDCLVQVRVSEKIAVIIVTGCLALSVNSDAQDIKKIRLKGLYVGTFAQVLDQISREHGVSFTFDREVLERQKVEDYPDGLALEHFLTYWCILFDLRFYVVNNGLIEVVSDTPAKNRKTIERRLRRASKHGLPPVPYE
jgi:hypothetical protein